MAKKETIAETLTDSPVIEIEQDDTQTETFEPNISFVGKSVEVHPGKFVEEEPTTRMETPLGRITLPSAEKQLLNRNFYHERAAEIIGQNPLYKAFVKSKGAK